MKEQILIVEDEASVALALQHALRSPRGGSYKVEICGSAESALQRLEDVEFDLIITDLRLPGMSGLDLIEKTQSFTPATRTVLITAFGSFHVAEKAKELADVYISKPFRLQDIIQAVKGLLNGVDGGCGTIESVYQSNKLVH
jgi:DNA-binding NtrC family response regulator